MRVCVCVCVAVTRLTIISERKKEREIHSHRSAIAECQQPDWAPVQSSPPSILFLLLPLLFSFSSQTDLISSSILTYTHRQADTHTTHRVTQYIQNFYGTARLAVLD